MKSLPLPKAADHCSTSKYTEEHLCPKSWILLHVSFSAEISVRGSMQGKWCCSAARGVGPSAELPSGPRCLAWSWGFSRWWQRVRALHKWFHSPQHRESAPAPSGTGCCDVCQDPATLPENLSSCQGKEPSLQGERRDAWGAEEISRDSEDFTSKAAWDYGKNCGFHNLACTHTYTCAFFIHIYTHTKEGKKQTK